MKQPVFKLIGLTEEQKAFLEKYALEHFGNTSKTKAILHIINNQMKGQNKDKNSLFQLPEPSIDTPVIKKRLQLSLRDYDYDNLEKLATESDSSIQYYVMTLIVQHLYGQRRMVGREIELLRQSNYELHKIGVNLNQIAKVINSNGMTTPPVFTNTLAEIDRHVDLVKNLLNKNLERY